MARRKIVNTRDVYLAYDVARFDAPPAPVPPGQLAWFVDVVEAADREKATRALALEEWIGRGIDAWIADPKARIRTPGTAE